MHYIFAVVGRREVHVHVWIVETTNDQDDLKGELKSREARHKKL
jgi:hypothetical protein